MSEREQNQNVSRLLTVAQDITEQCAEQVRQKQEQVNHSAQVTYDWLQQQIIKKAMATLSDLIRGRASAAESFLLLIPVQQDDYLADRQSSKKEHKLTCVLKPNSAPMLLRDRCSRAGFEVGFCARTLDGKEDVWLRVGWGHDHPLTSVYKEEISELIESLPVPQSDLNVLRAKSRGHEVDGDIEVLSKLKSDAEDTYNDKLLQVIANAKKARPILEAVPQLMIDAAEKGRSCVSVFRFEQEGYKVPDGASVLDVLNPKYLLPNSTAQLIYEKCRQAGFRPILRFWEDETGVQRGYEIQVRW